MFGIFRKPLTVKRQSEGAWVNGFWVAGSETTLTIQASAQPANADDMQLLPDGKRLQGAYKIYTDADLIVAIEGVTQVADKVVINGQDYEISAANPWQNGIIPHNEFMATRVQS